MNQIDTHVCQTIESDNTLENDVLLELDGITDDESDVDQSSVQNITLENFTELNLHEYKIDGEIDSKSPYVKIQIEDNIKIVKKSALCWLINEKIGR
jgi:hypothetical protein